jgi:hypothetical protein
MSTRARSPISAAMRLKLAVVSMPRSCRLPVRDASILAEASAAGNP